MAHSSRPRRARRPRAGLPPRGRQPARGRARGVQRAGAKGAEQRARARLVARVVQAPARAFKRPRAHHPGSKGSPHARRQVPPPPRADARRRHARRRPAVRHQARACARPAGWRAGFAAQRRRRRGSCRGHLPHRHALRGRSSAARAEPAAAAARLGAGRRLAGHVRPLDGCDGGGARLAGRRRQHARVRRLSSHVSAPLQRVPRSQRRRAARGETPARDASGGRRRRRRRRLVEQRDHRQQRPRRAGAGHGGSSSVRSQV